jgi:uncharacterized protein with HEPN domain
MSEEGRIIVLTDLIEQKLRKEKEIEFYQKQLLEFQEKIQHLQKDVDLTKLIIDVITSDNVIDIKDRVVKAIPIIGEKK